MTIGHFMKVLRFSDNILGPILVKNQGLRGVRGGKKNVFFFSILTQNTCVPKMKFLGLPLLGIPSP